MKIADVLSPDDGLFSNMPQDIWGASFDPSLVDIELFTRIGELEVSPTTRHFVRNGALNTPELSRLLYQRYHRNWERIWDALIAEYDIMLTSTSDETRTVARATDDLETRALEGKEGGTLSRENTVNRSNVRSGSIDRSDDSMTTRNLTDRELRDTLDTTQDSSGETTKDTFADSVDTNTTLTKTGSERTAGTDNETRDLDRTNRSTLTKSGSETTTGTDHETRNLDTTHTGTKGIDESGTQTGTGGTVIDNGLYGVGSSSLANE